MYSISCNRCLEYLLSVGYVCVVFYASTSAVFSTTSSISSCWSLLAVVFLSSITHFVKAWARSPACLHSWDCAALVDWLVVDHIKLLLYTLEVREPKQFLVGMLADCAASHLSALCCLSDLVGVPPRTLTLFHTNSLTRCNLASVSTNGRICPLRMDLLLSAAAPVLPRLIVSAGLSFWKACCSSEVYENDTMVAVQFFMDYCNCCCASMITRTRYWWSLSLDDIKISLVFAFFIFFFLSLFISFKHLSLLRMLILFVRGVDWQVVMVDYSRCASPLPACSVTSLFIWSSSKWFGFFSSLGILDVGWLVGSLDVSSRTRWAVASSTMSCFTRSFVPYSCWFTYSFNCCIKATYFSVSSSFFCLLSHFVKRGMITL